MLEELKKEGNYTLTENGALSYASSMNHCLDLFATAGGLRHATDEEIQTRFMRAYTESPNVAVKILFYARDIMEGLGERRFFRVILKDMCFKYAGSVQKNIQWIAEYGRYDDLLVLLDTPCEKAAISFMKEQLSKDLTALNNGMDTVSLLAKWLPSVNTSSKEKVRLGKKLARAFGMSEKEYRKTLVILREKIDIIENHLRTIDYSFDYAKQPGKAMLKYRAAFYRNDAERYMDYLNSVGENKAEIHTDTLMPYEIVKPLYDRFYAFAEVGEAELKSLETMWNAQKDFAGERDSLVVIDGSGSMYGWKNPMPATVAQSLGLYFAEKNTGAFANHFITFSSRPQLVEVKGKNLLEKIRYISSFDEIADTNIEAVFDLILNAAINNNVSQSEMPERIFIISDMEFNYCTKNSGITNFENAKRKFEKAGYHLPKVVFWNVASRALQLPVTENEQGVLLVSGCNARLFEQVLTDSANPYSYMMEVVESKRYEKIVA